MTSKQLRAILDRLELSQQRAARLLGIDARTMRRYVLAEVSIPEPIAIIFRLLDAGKITIEDL
jgi:transcriptional regulator with XRE-family HTH domain